MQLIVRILEGTEGYQLITLTEGVEGAGAQNTILENTGGSHDDIPPIGFWYLFKGKAPHHIGYYCLLDEKGVMLCVIEISSQGFALAMGALS